MTSPSVFHRFFLLYDILNTFFLALLPNHLKSLLLPSSWFSPLPPASPLKTPPSRDPAELKRVFQMFDRNGDGRITASELSHSMENLGIFIPDTELTQIIDKIDANGDGCVDIDEFGELYESLMDEREEDDMGEAFNVFDQNGDGFISVDELRSVLASLGINRGRSIEDCKMMITKVDADGDGRVSFKEFKEMMRGGGLSVLA